MQLQLVITSEIPKTSVSVNPPILFVYPELYLEGFVQTESACPGARQWKGLGLGLSFCWILLQMLFMYCINFHSVYYYFITISDISKKPHAMSWSSMFYLVGFIWRLSERVLFRLHDLLAPYSTCCSLIKRMPNLNPVSDIFLNKISRKGFYNLEIIWDYSIFSTRTKKKTFVFSAAKKIRAWTAEPAPCSYLVLVGSLMEGKCDHGPLFFQKR